MADLQGAKSALKEGLCQSGDGRGVIAHRGWAVESVDDAAQVNGVTGLLMQ